MYSTFLHNAVCYFKRPKSSPVRPFCLPVSVCPLDTTVSRAKTVEPIRDAVWHV